MKTKLIIFLASVIILVPAISSAMIVPPSANLTIIVNTQESDSSFTFDLTDCPTIICNNPSKISLQTQGLSGSTSRWINAFPNEHYWLGQESMPGLKLDGIFCTSDNIATVFSYQGDSVNFFPNGPVNITCVFDNVRMQGKTPILIVPGLLGTDISKDGGKLWLDLAHNFTDIGDQFMDSLQFNQNLVPVDTNLNMGNVIGKETVNVGVGDVMIYDYTSGLIQEFKNQGHVENTDLFMFPYDWRYGASGKMADGKTNSDLLALKIQSIMQQTGSSKVDVVAHSLGGLIVKQYVADHLSDNHIGKAVFVGVPNTGAPKAVKVLLQGDSFGIPWLSQAEMKKIAANMPAAYDLLPSQQYYSAKGSYITTIDQTKCQNDYTTPCAVKDLDYQESKDFFIGQGYNSLAITEAGNLHTEALDNFDLRTAGIDLYAIDGCKSATLSNVVVTKYNSILGQETDYAVKFAPGDNTVPFESATNLPINQSNKYYALVSDHSKMPSAEGIRQEIVNLISGSNLDTGSAFGENLITQDISKCQLNGKAISVFSPVDIFVTDQNGNRLGLASDGSIINEIPNTDFEILGEHKFLYLPQDNGQTYTIKMQGTGTGTYTIKSQDISNSQVASTELFKDLPVTSALTGQINIDPTDNSTTLSVKQKPTDIAITIIPIEVPNNYIDKTPPEVIIQFDPIARDLRFTGTDNFTENSKVLIQDKDDIVTLKDAAGNTTEIKLKNKDRKKSMKAEIKSIKYNGVEADISKNKMSFSWSINKKDQGLKTFSEQVKSKKDYNISADCDGEITKITGNDLPGRIKQSFNGLKIVKIITSKGDLSWSY